MFEVAVGAGDTQEVYGQVNKLAQVVFGWRIETCWRAHRYPPIGNIQKSGLGTHFGTKPEIAQLVQFLLDYSTGRGWLTHVPGRSSIWGEMAVRRI
jgi:hypothetical protein